jgi:hypothetical protein
LEAAIPFAIKDVSSVRSRRSSRRERPRGRVFAHDVTRAIRAFGRIALSFQGDPMLGLFE